MRYGDVSNVCSMVSGGKLQEGKRKRNDAILGLGSVKTFTNKTVIKIACDELCDCDFMPFFPVPCLRGVLFMGTVTPVNGKGYLSEERASERVLVVQENKTVEAFWV